MDDTYYALIKLTTGEEIISEIFTDDNEEDPIIALGSPVTIEITARSNHNVLKFEPWVKVSFEETLFISVKAGFQDITQQSGRGVKLNRTMGSLGTVDDARKILEKCLKLKLDT